MDGHGRQKLTLALQALPVESVQEGAAVVAPCQALVALGREAVRHVHLETDLRVRLREKFMDSLERKSCTSIVSIGQGGHRTGGEWDAK